MKWYISKIVFQIICGDGQHTAQFDEQLRLIEAADAEAAFHKATALGLSEAETFYNQKEQLVQWKFIDVSDLYHLSLIDSGELVSKIEEVTDAEDYIRLVHSKSEQIQQKYRQKSLQLL